MKDIVTNRKRGCQAGQNVSEDIKILRKKDGILLISVFLLIALLFCWQSCRQKEAAGKVRVSVGGEEVGTWSLSENRKITLTGIEGGSNLLVIQDGSVYIEEADCPDGLCIRQGSIQSVGESIICLPHEIVVEIIGTSQEGEPDAMVR